MASTHDGMYAVNGDDVEENAPLLRGEDKDYDGDVVRLQRAAPRPPLRGAFTLAVLALDVTLAIALFCSAAAVDDAPEEPYFERAIEDYSLTTSTFDLLLVSIARTFVLAPLFWNMYRLEPLVVRLVALVVAAGSLAFVVAKTVLIGLADAGFGGVAGGASFTIAFLALSIAFCAVETLTTASAGRLIRAAKAAPPPPRPSSADEGAKDKDGKPRPKLNTATLRRLFGLAREQWRILAVGMVALVVSSATQLILPAVVGVLVDALDTDDEEEARQQLTNSIVLLMIIFAIGSVFGFLRGWMFTLAGQSVVAQLRARVFHAVVVQEMAFFDQTRTGELTSRLTSDTQVIQNAVTVNISMLVRYLFQIIGSIVIMFVLSWQLSLVMMSVVPVVAVSAVIYGRYLQGLQKRFQDELANATTVAEEVISNIRTMRSFSKEESSADQYREAINKSFQIGRKIAFMYGAFNGLIGFVPQAAIALVLWYGGTLVVDGMLQTGQLTSFLLYTLSVAMAFAFLSSLFGDFMSAVGASERIFQLLDRQPAIHTKGGRRLPDFKGQVTFRDVSFVYPTREDQQVLKNVSFEMNPGQVFALVGPSGGGKSTIVTLLERFYDVTSGEILVDGVNIKELDPEWFRQNVALVSQEPVLFATTIRENICYGVSRPVTDAEIEAAARAANAHDFIVSFSDKYETTVGERGVRLSGGQKQRIAIARALLMNPKVLLLDEATSALDAESEYLVQDAIDRAMVNRTVLVIAHRLSTVRSANCIMVLANGTVKEMGSHDELLQKPNGLYRKLVNRQIQGDLSTVFAEIVKEEEDAGEAGQQTAAAAKDDDADAAAPQ